MVILSLILLGLVAAVPFVVVYYSQRFSRIEYQLRRLEYELQILRSSSGSASSEKPATPAPELTPYQERVAAPPPPATAVLSPPQPQPRPFVAPEPQPTAPPTRTQQEWEALVGGKLMNRVGALALIIGVGFFLKYAFDNNWISETMRVVIGALAGIGLLVLGARSHTKNYAIFAQGLLGAGIAILYISIYASFNFYRLVPQPVAFLLMSLVTAAAFWLGIRYNSLAIAMLGWAGGFLTPILLATDRPNSLGLLGYLALLDLGVLAVVAIRNSWSVLRSLALVATFSVYFAWFDEYHSLLSQGMTILAVSVFWLLFHLSDARDRYLRIKQEALDQVTSIANAGLFVLALWLILTEPEDERLRGLILLLPAVAIAATYELLKHRLDSNNTTRDQYWITSAVLIGLATYSVVDEYALVIAWSMEASLLCWLGIRASANSLWRTGLAFLFVAGIVLLSQQETYGWEPITDFRLLLNARALAFVVLALTAAFSALVIKRLNDSRTAAELALLVVTTCVAVLAMLSVEVLDLFRKLIAQAGAADAQTMLAYRRGLAVSVLWSLFATTLIWVGVRKAQNVLVAFGAAVLPAAVFAALVLGLSYRPIADFGLFFNLRFAAFLIIVGCLVCGAYLLDDWSGSQPVRRRLLLGAHLATVTLVLLLFTAEVWNQYDKLIAQAGSGLPPMVTDRTTQLRNLQQLSLSGVWLVFSIILMALGIWKRARLLRITSIVLFGLTILKVFLYDLSFLDTLYRIFSFIGLGVILLAVSFLYQKYKAIILADRGMVRVE